MAGFIGLALLGRSPRPDFERTFAPHLGTAPFRMAGALDGVADGIVGRMNEPSGVYPIHIPVPGVGQVDVPRDTIRPYLQACIDRLCEEGAEAVAVLCAGDIGLLDAPVPLLTAGRLVPSLVRAMLAGAPLGIVTPNEGQVPFAAGKWAAEGFRVEVRTVPPYAAAQGRNAALSDCARGLAGGGAKVIVLDCFGFDAADAKRLHREVRLPVFAAREVTARACGLLASYLG